MVSILKSTIDFNTKSIPIKIFFYEPYRNCSKNKQDLETNLIFQKSNPHLYRLNTKEETLKKDGDKFRIIRWMMPSCSHWKLVPLGVMYTEQMYGVQYSMCTQTQYILLNVQATHSRDIFVDPDLRAKKIAPSFTLYRAKEIYKQFCM